MLLLTLVDYGSTGKSAFIILVISTHFFALNCVVLVAQADGMIVKFLTDEISDRFPNGIVLFW